MTSKRESNADPDDDAPYKKKMKTKEPNEQTSEKYRKPWHQFDKPDWKKIKNEKKEVRLKRKQAKGLYEVVTKAKHLGEKLRRKRLEGGKQERDKLVAEIHTLLGGKGNYAKIVLSHDMGRIVQYLLKFGNQKIRNEIGKELIPSTVEMLLSKYGKFCIKRLLKYGNSQIRSQTITAMYGHAVKLTSHSVSAPIFEYAYSTWAQPLEKQHLIQEFFGDMYKNSKDNNIKHLRDVYKNSQDMKSAALGATKANLLKVLNKNLLDSGLVQSVLSQFLSECSNDDRSEIISQLAQHIVIISNSRDGARAAMCCIWNGTNRERKIAVKVIKEHVVELCKHEYGHTVIIALFDAADDTVLINKAILSKIFSHALEIATNEWGRKVLLWLVAPADSVHFHPAFIKELNSGRENSLSKKPVEVRRKEILEYTSNILIINIASESRSWFANASIAVVALAILKTGNGEELKKAYKGIATLVVDSNWRIKENNVDTYGIEDAGLHMTIKKLLQHDKVCAKNNNPTFGEILLQEFTNDVVSKWITLNRGCFLLVSMFENSTESVQNDLQKKLGSYLKLIEEQSSCGAKILLSKLK